jgi:hypothetical protein
MKEAVTPSFRRLEHCWSDVTNHDVSSSDGESVEVIDAEEESRKKGEEVETQLTPAEDTLLVSNTESEVPVPQSSPPEEMFDSSFRWFLIYATVAVLASNTVFFVADNGLTWNAVWILKHHNFVRGFSCHPETSEW